MEHCNEGELPIGKGDKLTLKQCPDTYHDIQVMKDKPYALLVRSVMYEKVCTRPNLAFALSVLGMFQSNPREKVLRYLKRMQSYVLCYSYVDNLELVYYTDVDLGGCVDDKLSTSGYIFMLAKGTVS